MAISTENVNTLNDEYKKLLSQGLSGSQATSQLKSTLQSSNTASGANVYDTLKTQYQPTGEVTKVPTQYGGGTVSTETLKQGAGVTPGGAIIPNINKPAAPTPTKPIETTITPQQEEVKPVAPGTITTPTVTDQAAESQKVLDNILSTNNLTDEQKKWWNTNVFNTPESRDKFLQMTDQERQAYMSNINQANIMARDYKLTSEYAKTDFDRKMADAKAQADLEEQKARQNLDTMANNFAMAQGTSGRLKSRNLQNAISDQLKVANQTYQNLVATNDRYIQALADEYKYNNTRASNEYNDQMAKVKQSLREQIETLQATGAMQTAGGLLQAKNFIDSAVAAGDIAMQQYSYNLQIGQQRVAQMASIMKEQNQFSKELTEASNSPYLLNAQGGVMTDASGNPLTRDVSKKITDTFTDNQGNVTLLYEDGTFSKPQMGIAKKEVEKPIFVEVTGGKQQMVLDPTTGMYKPVGEVMPLEEQMTPYQQAQIDLERQQLSQMTPYQQAQVMLEQQKIQPQPAAQTTVTTGNLVSRPIGQSGKSVTLDSNAMDAYNSASEEMIAKGINVIVGDSIRSKEKQKSLVEKGLSWTYDSKHLNGTAIDIYSGQKNGKLIAPTKDQISIMNANGWYQPEATLKKGDYGHFEFMGTGQFDPIDVEVMNSFTPTEKNKQKNNPAYKEFLSKKDAVMRDPNSSIQDILKYSQGGKDLGETSIIQLDKFNAALSQIGDITTSIKSQQSGPILGFFRTMNPYDTDAQAIKAKLSSLVPNLARGVYGEVGVLTDNDIANYSKTVPNLRATEDVNKAILSMTLKTIANGYKSKLQSLAAAGKDVSGYSGIYTQLTSEADRILKEITPKSTQTQQPTQTNKTDIKQRLLQLRSKK